MLEELSESERRVLINATLVCGVVVACIMLLTFSVADIAWKRTPDVASFRQFAQPGTNRFESKFLYLFSALILQCVGGVFWVYQIVFRQNQKFGRGALVLVWLIFTVALFLVGLFQAANALEASQQPALSMQDLLRNLVSYI